MTLALGTTNTTLVLRATLLLLAAIAIATLLVGVAPSGDAVSQVIAAAPGPAPAPAPFDLAR